jgi:hypothetical protein
VDVDGPRRKYCRAGVWGEEEAGRKGKGRDRLRLNVNLGGMSVYKTADVVW